MNRTTFNLGFDGGGGGEIDPFFLFIFFTKNMYLRPTCKYLNLAIFYHAKNQFPENFVNKKFYYISSLLFVKTIEKVIRLCIVLVFLFGW